MDPLRDFLRRSSKPAPVPARAPLSEPSNSNRSPEPRSAMPPPPAYHTVVDSDAPIPWVNPYDPEDEDAEKDDEMPEININANTQIRGHGNIISIAQVDSLRIAHLLAVLLQGGPLTHTQPQGQAQQQTAFGGAQQPSQERTEGRSCPKVNITINCGATIVGDRNIVGPGLGNLARHIEQNRYQASQQQQQQQQQQPQQQQNQAHANQGAAFMQNASYGSPVGAGQPAMATPPLSRSSSLGGDSSSSPRGLKRKTEDDIEENPVKRNR